MGTRIDEQQSAIAWGAVREVEHIETLAGFEQLAEERRDASRTGGHRDDVDQHTVTIDHADVGDRLECEGARVEIPGWVDGNPFGVMAARRQGRPEVLDDTNLRWRGRRRGSGKPKGDRSSGQQGQSAHESSHPGRMEPFETPDAIFATAFIGRQRRSRTPA